MKKQMLVLLLLSSVSNADDSVYLNCVNVDYNGRTEKIVKISNNAITTKIVSVALPGKEVFYPENSYVWQRTRENDLFIFAEKPDAIWDGKQYLRISKLSLDIRFYSDRSRESGGIMYKCSKSTKKL